MSTSPSCPKCGGEDIAIRYHDRPKTEATIMAMEGALVTPLPCLFEPPCHLHHWCDTCKHQWAEVPLSETPMLVDGVGRPVVPAGGNFVAPLEEQLHPSWFGNVFTAIGLAVAALVLLWARGL